MFENTRSALYNSSTAQALREINYLANNSNERRTSRQIIINNLTLIAYTIHYSWREKNKNRVKVRDDVSSLVLCKGQNLLINIVAAELIINSVSCGVCV